MRNLLRVAFIAGALLLNFPAEVASQSPRLEGPAQIYVAPDTLNADTLHVAPWVARTLAEFDQDSLHTPRVFCVTSTAQWPHYLYIRHLRPNELILRCIGNEPIFVQSLQCPQGPIAPSGGTPLFILVQCGPNGDVSYYVPARPPNARSRG